MQALGDAVQIRQVVVRPVNAKKRIERFPAPRRVLRDPQPELLGFRGQTPFRSETREIDFAIGLVPRGPLGRMPERGEFRVRRSLARLLRAIGLISETQIFGITPRAAAGP